MFREGLCSPLRSPVLPRAVGSSPTQVLGKDGSPLMVLQEEEDGAGRQGERGAEQDTQSCWALFQKPAPDLENRNFRSLCPGIGALSELPGPIAVIVLVWTLLSRASCPCTSSWT